jgi:hypothetical protein
MSSVSSFVHEQILRQSKETTATPSTPVPSPPAAVPTPPPAIASAPPATPSAPPTTAPAPSANEPASPAPPSMAPAVPSATSAAPPASTPRRDARVAPPSRAPANCGTAREDRDPWSRRCAPVEDDRRRAVEDVIPEGVRRNSRLAGPCIGGVGGCYWGGARH